MQINKLKRKIKDNTIFTIEFDLIHFSSIGIYKENKAIWRVTITAHN